MDRNFSLMGGAKRFQGKNYLLMAYFFIGDAPLLRYVIPQIMPQQAHDLQLVQCVKDRIVGLMIATVAGKQLQHGFHAIASLQPSGAA